MSTLTPIPLGLKPQTRSSKDYVRGLSPLPYIVRQSSGDWSQDFGPYQPQRYGPWDTSCCWGLSGINVIEDECDFSKYNGDFPASSLVWLQSNGYFDSSGSFSFSEWFIEILSGVKDNGNDQSNFWKLVNTYGLLPRSDLNYDNSLSFSSRLAFNDYYFNPNLVTQSMRDKALMALKYIKVAYEWVGQEGVPPPLLDLRAALLESPLQIGIPVAMDTWNSGTVIYDGGTVAQHAVELYKIGTDGTYYIFDQYEPHLKTLSPDYYIPSVTLSLVTPIIEGIVPPIGAKPYPNSVWVKVWTAVWEYFESIID